MDPLQTRAFDEAVGLTNRSVQTRTSTILRPISEADGETAIEIRIENDEPQSPKLLASLQDAKAGSSNLTAANHETAASRVLGIVELLENIFQMLLDEGRYTGLLYYLPRVNRFWKAVIDNNTSFQKSLFFIPWEEHDYLYPEYGGMFNPFLRNLCFKKNGQPDEQPEPGCDYDFGPAPAHEDETDSDNGSWVADDPPAKIFFEFNWRKVEKNPKFMREDASWRRMLPAQPPRREIWNVYRPSGLLLNESKRRYLRAPFRELEQEWPWRTKLLGDIYNDVLFSEEDPSCLRTRTMIRSSERYDIVVEINVQKKEVNTIEDVRNILKSPLPCCSAYDWLILNENAETTLPMESDFGLDATSIDVLKNEAKTTDSTEKKERKEALQTLVSLQDAKSDCSTPAAKTYESAASRVLTVVELLENIFRESTLLDLLCRLQRVNRFWKAVIDDSTFIQKALCFMPWEENEYPERSPEFNPLMWRICYRDIKAIESGCLYDFGPAPPKDDETSSDDGGWDSDEEISSFREFDWRKVAQDPRYTRKDASWRKMLPVQPPVREIWYVYRWHTRCHPLGDTIDGARERYIRKIEVGGKRIGATYDDVLFWEAEPYCTRTRTMIRSSERYGAILSINVQIETSDAQNNLKEDRGAAIPDGHSGNEEAPDTDTPSQPIQSAHNPQQVSDQTSSDDFRATKKEPSTLSRLIKRSRFWRRRR